MALTASAPTKPASPGNVDPASVATKKEAIGLVIAGKWGEAEYLAWEASRTAASRGAVTARLSRPDPDKKRVGGRLILTGGGIGQGSPYGALTLFAEQVLLLYDPTTQRAILEALREETDGKNPEVKVKTYTQGGNKGKTHEVWTLGDLEVDDPSGFPSRLEQAIKRLVPVASHGNGNGR